MPTFAELSIEIPLFAADAAEASGWAPTGTCSVCDGDRPGFEIGVGCYLETTCRSCGATTPAPADGRVEPCIECGQATTLEPSLEGLHGCWRCLRDGKWTTTMDTEAGMVTPPDAAVGRTHGLPGPVAGHPAWDVSEPGQPLLAGWPTSEPNADGWRRAVIPRPILWELVRTPNYVSWQGEQWLFHCQQAMTFLGPWGKADFESTATGLRPSEWAVRASGLPPEMWTLLPDRGGEGSVVVYMFRCGECDTYRGHFDMD